MHDVVSLTTEISWISITQQMMGRVWAWFSLAAIFAIPILLSPLLFVDLGHYGLKYRQYFSKIQISVL